MKHFNKIYSLIEESDEKKRENPVTNRVKLIMVRNAPNIISLMFVGNEKNTLTLKSLDDTIQ